LHPKSGSGSRFLKFTKNNISGKGNMIFFDVEGYLSQLEGMEALEHGGSALSHGASSWSCGGSLWSHEGSN
jgi:hypothetical protein